MWTVHMLAPFRYHEDLLRSYSPHLLNYAFPLERYVCPFAFALIRVLYFLACAFWLDMDIISKVVPET